ncbi:hypothetical protein B0H67DRAFT_642043 [Lasiosphaeris hirsuta]|uniref:Uncharacterized protein n=1 Tax=Lasiosphaeris hirsuta TaxID=260670 RepID=A0AA40B0Y8_9PEZI|nr:hypothetical protein B0H67DRAFT_642043 [Lasiosphaeris hirsuta]
MLSRTAEDVEDFSRTAQDVSDLHVALGAQNDGIIHLLQSQDRFLATLFRRLALGMFDDNNVDLESYGHDLGSLLFAFAEDLVHNLFLYELLQRRHLNSPLSPTLPSSMSRHKSSGTGYNVSETLTLSLSLFQTIPHIPIASSRFSSSHWLAGI